MSVIRTRERSPQIIRHGTVPPPGAAGAAAAATRFVQVRAPGQETGMTGREVLRIIRKRKWLIIFSLVICVSLAVGVTLLWLQYAPYYTTAAVMEVQQPETTIIQREAQNTPIPLIEAQAAKYVNLTMSERVLQTAINTDRIRNTTWFNRNPDNAIQRLMLDLKVTNRSATPLVFISMTGTNRDELPEIINAVAEAAQTRSQELNSQSTQDQLRVLTSEKANLEEQRDRVRAEKAKLLRDSDVPDMLDRSNVLKTKLASLSPQVTAMELEYAQAEAQLQLIRQQMQTGQIEALPQVIQALDYDISLRQLRTAMLNQKAREESLLKKFGDQHRAVLDFKAHAESMKKQVEERKKQLLDAQVNSLIANAESRKAIILERLTKLREQYRFVDLSVRQLEAAINQYNQYDTQDKTLTNDIGRINARVVDLRMLLKAKPPLSIMATAPTPRDPSFPQWSIMVPLGVVLGLFVGVGLAFVLELIDTSIKGPADITRRVDLPLLGMVPHLDDLEEDIKDLRLAFSTHPESLVSEAFRQVRTCLQFSGPASQRRTLLVTSALPEDGRTAVSLNLAASNARNGRKVLVVDSNFRQPMIRTLFPEVPEGGLSTALVGQASWRKMVLEVEPNFSVMASGPLPPNPGELLGSEQMSAMISEMVAEYDQVIFDGAPCLLVTDAPALSTLVDAVVLVVRAGANTHGIVQRTREMLDRIGGHVVGVVLNGVKTVAGGYLRKNYEAFYDYRERAKLPQQ